VLRVRRATEYATRNTQYAIRNTHDRIIITGSKGAWADARACAPHHADLKSSAKSTGRQPAVGDRQGDVVLDFSSHTRRRHCRLCAEHKKAIVIGTPATPGGPLSFTELSSQIPMVLSSNFSTGVNALFWLTRKAAEILGHGFDLEIVEMPPSPQAGCAQRHGEDVGEILARVRQQQLDAVAGMPLGIVGERTAAEIGLHSWRRDVVGEHTWSLPAWRTARAGAQGLHARPSPTAPCVRPPGGHPAASLQHAGRAGAEMR